MPDPELYFEGRFSNGPVWVEYLTDADHFNVTLTDNALSGAHTDGLEPPGLVEQVTAYVALEELALSSTALFVIWIGGNDFKGTFETPRWQENIACNSPKTGLYL